MELQKHVAAIVAEALTVEESDVKSDSTFASLGADSLDVVELVMKIEEEFGVEISDDDAQTLKTVQDVCNFIEASKST